MTPPVGPTEVAVPAPRSSASSFEMSWDKSTTPLEAIERSMYALADQLTGSVSDAEQSWNVTIHPRGPQADPAALAHRIRQEVNDQVLRVRIAERTEPVRNLVFALAFSRSGLAAGGGERSSEAEPS